MAQRKVKARYKTVGPRKEKVRWMQYTHHETLGLQNEEQEELMDVYWVYFPQGHSIRVTSYERLKQLGYHVRPRMVDMETGDVVDAGGDPYEFGEATPYVEPSVLVDEDDFEIVAPQKRSRAAQA